MNSEYMCVFVLRSLSGASVTEYYYVNVRMYGCVRACMYVCMCAGTCTCTCMYIASWEHWNSHHT